MTEQAEELTRGEALARVAVLEAEIAELRKRVCVPDVATREMKDAALAELERQGFDCQDFVVQPVYQAMIAASPAPVERVEQEALRKRFDDIEREICEGKHTAASVFTQMRTAALYTTPQPAPTAAQDVAGLPFVRKILEKLERFRECAEDDEGVDIGRHWLDVLTRLGLLNRVQRSPARWEMTAQADDALEAAHQSGGVN